MIDCSIICCGDGVAEHTLCGVLVELEEFQSLPVRPIIPLKEFSASELHETGGIVEDGARVNNVVLPQALHTKAVFDEVDAVVELVVGKLGEIGSRHNWDAFIGDVGSDFWV